MSEPQEQPTAHSGPDAAPLPGSEAASRFVPSPELRAWLHAQHLACTRQHEPAEAELRAVMRRVSEEAHRCRLRVEQVIVALKQEWRALPDRPDAEWATLDGWRREVLAERFVRAREALLERILALLIDEFYRVR